MKISQAEEPRGLQKKSFSMYFGGGEIWFEHLDSLQKRDDLALAKLEADSCLFLRPSLPSVIAVNLDETRVTAALISALQKYLMHAGKHFTRVAVVGLGPVVRIRLRRALAGASFALGFTNDFEQAKEWLVQKS